MGSLEFILRVGLEEMATDYIMFIHGVNVRDRQGYEQDAMRMFERIKAAVQDQSRVLKPVILFWGDISESSLQKLGDNFKRSPAWKKLWFREFREEQILSFVGDAALYLSRHVSAEIVRNITQQALDQMNLSIDGLRTPPEGDRVHLVTHSWGTVILFDVMFAPRWDDDDLEEDIRRSIQNIRAGLFGVGTAENQGFGIPIASINTMGSPIALFSLIQAQGAESFNLTPNLTSFLKAIFEVQQKPLPWRNFVHPGDPIAYPLEGIKPMLLDDAGQFVQLQDILSPTSGLSLPFSQNLLSILNGGKAHGSYWHSQKIAAEIGRLI